jgi:hypothetical protein
MRALVIFLLAALMMVACGADTNDGADVDAWGPSRETGVVAQRLDAARTRVVQEASFAMVGNYNTYTPDNWPTSTTYASYYYTLTDTGAWNALLGSDRYGPNGYYVSCMRYRSAGHIHEPCWLSESTGFGSFEMPYYTCQGSCPSNRMRGGQCKPFMNLVAYRSGQYHGPNYAFKAFPSDPDITNWSTAADQMPYATYANILPGDFLRLPNGHALTIVRKVSISQVVVFDSNWVDDGAGHNGGAEVVGSHALGFTGSGNYNLGNYRVLKCAYNGNC